MNVTTAVRLAAKSSAVPAGLLRRRSADDLVVLLYHRIGSGNREIDVDVGSFASQMAMVAESGQAASLDEALQADARGVIVSIDDGFSDFYTRVLPILVRHRVPAILYLATGFVEGQDFAPPGDALTWSQLAEAVATGLVTIGAHTHSHYDLSRADEATAYQEMGRSKDLIEDRLGRPCRHFSYPWSYSSQAAERVAGTLFESAALTWRTNRRSRLDPQRLGRTPVFRGDTSMFFKAKMAGRLDAEALVYRAARRGPWRKP